MAQAASLDDAAYFKDFGLTAQRLKLAAPSVLVMHPGPMNRGVEIASEVADGPRSVIREQVNNGVAVRMAVLASIAATLTAASPPALGASYRPGGTPVISAAAAIIQFAGSGSARGAQASRAVAAALVSFSRAGGLRSARATAAPRRSRRWIADRWRSRGQVERRLGVARSSLGIAAGQQDLRPQSLGIAVFGVALMCRQSMPSIDRAAGMHLGHRPAREIEACVNEQYSRRFDAAPFGAQHSSSSITGARGAKRASAAAMSPRLIARVGPKAIW